MYKCENCIKKIYSTTFKNGSTQKFDTIIHKYREGFGSLISRSNFYG